MFGAELKQSNMPSDVRVTVYLDKPNIPVRKGYNSVIVLVYFDGPLLMFRVSSTKCFCLGKVKNDRDTEIN